MSRCPPGECRDCDREYALREEDAAAREIFKLKAEITKLRLERAALFKIHKEDGTPCYHDQASGPSCVNDNHYRPPTYDDWMDNGFRAKR